MTPKQYKSLAAYMGRIANLVGLSDWDLTLHAKDPGEAANGESAIAAVHTPFGRRVANIRVTDDFENHSPDEQRMAVVHELLHIHSRGVADLVSTSLPKLLGVSAYETWFAAYTIHDELANDALTCALSPHLPLWEMPK